jgi:hypothetical protein
MGSRESRVSGGFGASWLKPILLFSLLLCFLGVFTLGFAGQLTDPTNPNQGHPWDDLCSKKSDPPPEGPPEHGSVLVLQFGPGHWIVTHLELASQKEGLKHQRSSGLGEKKTSHVFIFVR